MRGELWCKVSTISESAPKHVLKNLSSILDRWPRESTVPPERGLGCQWQFPHERCGQWLLRLKNSREQLSRLWRLHASWAWAWESGKPRRRKLSSIWHLSQPGKQSCWTAWGVRPRSKRKGPEELRTWLGFCVERQGLSETLWKSEWTLGLIPLIVPTGENVLPVMKISVCRGPGHGCLPWERKPSLGKTVQRRRQEHSPPAPHLIHPSQQVCTPAILSGSVHLPPQDCELLEDSNYFLCFPKVMDGVSSPGMCWMACFWLKGQC